MFEILISHIKRCGSLKQCYKTQTGPADRPGRPGTWTGSDKTKDRPKKKTGQTRSTRANPGETRCIY
jgi:hypothetical protein